MKAIFASGLLLGAAGAALAQPLPSVGTLTADVAAPGKAPTMTCQSLRSMHLAEIKVTQAMVAASGPMQLPDRAIALPAHCVVSVDIKPIRGSHVKMELWLPASDWNGKLMMIGNEDMTRNEGLGGSIPQAAMGDAVRRGYAVTALDGGHARTGGVHETAVKAKALTAAYYGGTARYTYWIAGSFGGRQGLEDVQMYPGDFDGVVVGAPVNETTAGGSNAATDLAVFKARGGKIIQYQVAAEAATPAEQSIGYFERVAAAQGGLDQTRYFYRLFVIPALERANGTFSFDWITTLEQWVEAGRAPQSVLANHNPSPDAVLKPPPPGAIVFEPAYGVRVMCAYPSIARLQGGLGEVPVDWICQPGPRGAQLDRAD
jgi:hypothetical protein